MELRAGSERYIEREIVPAIRRQVGKYSVIMISGPRQSGKTTLVREQFPDLPYFSLEDPDVRQQVNGDPRALFKTHGHRLILDEVQRVPELFSYIQGIVDSDRDSLFILSGSQNYLMMEKVSQTLAGRVALFYLLPLSYREIAPVVDNMSIDKYLWQGGYPRIYHRGVAVNDFYQSYLETYVQRDVRLIQNIGNLDTFQNFLGICAAFIGQVLNVNAIAKAAGISRGTAVNWLSILEASFIIRRVSPYFRNFKKRVVKSPKLYFTDTGLAAALLRLRNPDALKGYYQRGFLFENMVINEVTKGYYNGGSRPPFYHWRDSNQHEVDLLLDHGTALQPVEIKVGSTYIPDFFKHLTWFAAASSVPVEEPTVIYGGEERWSSEYGRLLPWREAHELVRL